MHAPISFVIVNLDGKKFLRKCIDSIINQTLPPAEIIVVDNGSADGSLELLADQYPSVRVCELDRNRGLTVAYAIGLEYAQHDWVLLSNNDVELDSRCIEELSRLARDASRIVVPRFVSMSQPHYDQSFLVRFIPSLAKPWSTMSQKLPDRPARTDVVGFGMLLMHRSLRSFMDHRFRIYFSEDDFSLQSRRSGVEIIINPSAIVYHYGGGTMGKVGLRKFRVFAHDWALYHGKWFEGWSLLPSVIFGAVVLLCRWLVPALHMQDFNGIPLRRRNNPSRPETHGLK